MPLKVDTEGEPWSQWSSKYKVDGNRIPFIYIIRADGQQMAGQSGGVDDAKLPAFLAQQLTQAGRVFNEGQLAQLSEAVEAAKKAMEAHDTAGAVRRLVALQKLGTPGSLGSYAKVAIEADELAKQCAEQGRAQIAEAKKKLAGDAPVEGALALAEARRVYGALPALRTDFAAVTRDASGGAAVKEAMEQARVLDQALQNVKTNEARAATALKQIIAKYPDSAAAKIAEQELAKLGDGKAPSAGASTEPSTEPATEPAKPKTTGGSDAKKVSSYLRMAKVFAESKPEKARQYAQQVIELAPGSDEAQEAKRLLEKLKE